MALHAHSILLIYDLCTQQQEGAYIAASLVLFAVASLLVFLLTSFCHSLLSRCSHALSSPFSPSRIVRLALSGTPRNACSETSAAWWAPWTRRWACRGGARAPTSPLRSCGSTPPTSSRPPMTFWSTPAPSSPTTARRSTSPCGPVCGASASCTTGAPWLRCASLSPRWPTTSTSPYDKVRESFLCDVSTCNSYTITQKWILIICSPTTDNHSSKKSLRCYSKCQTLRFIAQCGRSPTKEAARQ